MMKSGDYNSFADVVKLWVHEFARVISDRFFWLQELEVYDGMLREVMKKQLNFPTIDDMLSKPIVFTAFAGGQNSYCSVDSSEALKKVVDMKLVEYNESNAMMDLVLFEQAAQHISRISRIIINPAGNAMLIGVGGSGYQSLSRLAAFISGFEVKQLQITGSFKVDDLLEAFKEMFKLSGVKGQQLVYLMTDTQVMLDPPFFPLPPTPILSFTLVEYTTSFPPTI